MRILFTIILSIFLISTTYAGSEPISISSYTNELNNTIKRIDIDFSNVKESDTNFLYDINEGFNSNYIILSPSKVKLSDFEKTYNKDPINVIKYWNENTQLVGSHIDTCNDTVKKIAYIEKFIGGNRYLEGQGKLLKLSNSEVIDIFACYIKNNSFTHSEIKTTKATYRIHNISTALSLFNNTIWNTGSSLSMYSTIFGSDAEYKEGLGIRVNSKGKVEEFPTYGGGVCGVSTIFYQNALKTYSVDILSRRNHSNYYTVYYGGVVGLDATIYGEGSKAMTDLKLSNSTNSNILIKTYSYTTKSNLVYGVYFYSPFVEKNKVSTKSKKDKKGCYINTITQADGTEKTTKSCYIGVY